MKKTSTLLGTELICADLGFQNDRQGYDFILKFLFWTEMIDTSYNEPYENFMIKCIS